MMKKGEIDSYRFRPFRVYYVVCLCSNLAESFNSIVS